MSAQHKDLEVHQSPGDHITLLVCLPYSFRCWLYLLTCRSAVLSFCNGKNDGAAPVENDCVLPPWKYFEPILLEFLWGLIFVKTLCIIAFELIVGIQLCWRAYVENPFYDHCSMQHWSLNTFIILVNILLHICVKSSIFISMWYDGLFA